MRIKREHHINFWFIIVALIGVVLMQTLMSAPNATKIIPYSEFEQLLNAGRITDLVVGQTQIAGTLKDAAANEPHLFLTYRVPADIADKLTRAKLPFSGEPPPGVLASVLGWLLPALGFLLIWMFMVRPMTGQGIGRMMAVGKSKAKIYVETDTKVTFAAVSGVDEAKGELKEVVDS